MKIGILWFPGWTSTEHDLHEMMQYLKEKGIEYTSINLKSGLKLQLRIFKLCGSKILII